MNKAEKAFSIFLLGTLVFFFLWGEFAQRSPTTTNAHVDTTVTQLPSATTRINNLVIGQTFTNEGDYYAGTIFTTNGYKTLVFGQHRNSTYASATSPLWYIPLSYPNTATYINASGTTIALSNIDLGYSGNGTVSFDVEVKDDE